jgi:BlaI family transcriptional regulator, penicillinase repressor
MADRKMRIHSGEWDLLEALWESERGTAREITEVLAEKRGWAVSTVKTMLDRMVEKGLVHARQVGNVWEYTPAVEPVDARRSAWREFLAKAFGGSADMALHFLANDAELSKKERAELMAQLEKNQGKGRKDKGHA